MRAYDVIVNGTRTRMMFTDAEARRRGLLVDTKPAPATSNKARRAARDKG